jgi:ferredoxin-NADP reductase
VDELALEDQLELRGPIGGWFVWDPESAGEQPVALIAGGSGVVPLMAMLRARAEAGSTAHFTLLYSVRTPADALYVGQLRDLAAQASQVRASTLYTRAAPSGCERMAGRISTADLAEVRTVARFYVCGPTGFVESVSALLVADGHDPSSIRTERFGPSGG